MSANPMPHLRSPALPKPPRHENIEHLHRVLVQRMVQKWRITPEEAAKWAEAIIEALQEEVGGERLGSRGFYIPVRHDRDDRDRRIRELAGPGPHTRKRVRLVASNVQCSERTVWSVLKAPARTA